MEKLCKKCLVVKDISEFYGHSQMGDGHISKCKECTKADVRENRAKSLEYYRQYDRKRWDERGRRGVVSAASTERSQRWIAKNPEKRQAHIVVGNAIKAGRITRPSRCSACHSECRPDAHHEDYSKPFEIVWLCRKCHGDTWKKDRVSMPPRKIGGYVGSMKPTRACQ
jgi:hypothetical protein